MTAGRGAEALDALAADLEVAHHGVGAEVVGDVLDGRGVVERGAAEAGAVVGGGQVVVDGLDGVDAGDVGDLGQAQELVGAVVAADVDDAVDAERLQVLGDLGVLGLLRLDARGAQAGAGAVEDERHRVHLGQVDDVAGDVGVQQALQAVDHAVDLDAGLLGGVDDAGHFPVDDGCRPARLAHDDAGNHLRNPPLRVWIAPRERCGRGGSLAAVLTIIQRMATRKCPLDRVSCALGCRVARASRAAGKHPARSGGASSAACLCSQNFSRGRPALSEAEGMPRHCGLEGRATMRLDMMPVGELPAGCRSNIVPG